MNHVMYFLLLVSIGVAGKPVAAQIQWGRVVKVLDGDTYAVRVGGRNVRVRLAGMDAPELKQPGGRQATDSVRAFLRGRAVRLEQLGPDAYGRVLGRLGVELSAGGRVLALDSLMVARGWAWAYDPGLTTPRLAGLQQQAQEAGRGIWRCGTAQVVRPGIWRAYNKLEKARAWVGCPWY